MKEENWRSRIEAYASLRGLRVVGLMRTGTQGSVWLVAGKKNPAPWAVKLHSGAGNYRIERDCYLRLRKQSASHIQGFNIPTLLLHDDECLALELSVVKPPFVLDFAQAHLDFPPDFSSEVWAETHKRWCRLYGDDWPRVQGLLHALEELGIFYLDVHRGNVALEGA